MRLRRPHEVPATGAVSGAVLVLALMNVGSYVHELMVFGCWGIVYVVESVVRGAQSGEDGLQPRAAVDGRRIAGASPQASDER